MTKGEGKDAPILALTGKQRAVLDQLVRHKTSKEIARILGISPHTVDQRITSARQKFGVATRNELAAAYDQAMRIYEETVYQSPHVDPNRLGPQTANGADALSNTKSSTPIMAKPDWRLEDVQRYRVVPEVFESRYGALVRIGAIIAIAILLLIVLLGGVAAFGQLSDVLS